MRSIIWANSSFDVPGHHGDDAAAVDLLEVLRVGIELISAFLRQRRMALRACSLTFGRPFRARETVPTE